MTGGPSPVPCIDAFDFQQHDDAEQNQDETKTDMQDQDHGGCIGIYGPGLFRAIMREPIAPALQRVGFTGFGYPAPRLGLTRSLARGGERVADCDPNLEFAPGRLFTRRCPSGLQEYGSDEARRSQRTS